jgi:hypothetical protein
MTATKREADRLYRQYRPLLGAIVRAFHRCYPGSELEELQSQANFFFVTSLISHDEQRCPIANWLPWKVWRQLQEVRRVEQRRLKKLRRRNAVMELLPDPQEREIGTLLGNLSDDGKEAITHFLVVLRDQDGKRKTRRYADKVLEGLEESLRHEGWNQELIDCTLTEISEVLL